jgi:MHS family proline/betaine transporter-like MFS transporter
MAANLNDLTNSRIAGGTRAILAASVGNLLEWYDFSVYASFAIYIGENFFPKGATGADLVKAFLVFGLGFVIRPLGAIVIGIYGDRAGRKAALTATILVMSCGTLVIAVTPSYAMIGMAAPLLLVGGRVLQGFSAGGEIGSAAAFLVEHAPVGKKGLFTAWLQASMGMSNILAALVAFAVTALLPVSDVVSWGWRIPFVIGLSIVPVGLYLRRTLAETQPFREQAERLRGEHVPVPIVSVFRENSSSLLIGFGISTLWAVAVYVLLIFMPVFVQRAFGFTAAQAFGASLIENVFFVAGCFAFGAAADRIGHARVMVAGAMSLLLGVLPLFLWLSAVRSLLVLIIVLSAFGAMVASFVSVAPTLLSSLFPIAQRATGLSLVYNGAFTIFGGFAPAVLTWITATGAGSVFAPAWYVELAVIPAIVALAALSRRPHHLPVPGVSGTLEPPIRES